MKTILFSLISLCFLSLSAQTQVYLNINHKLGADDFSFNQESANNINTAFSVDRLEYYLSSFKLIHDNGMETEIPDLHALVDAGSTTQIDLGSLSFTEIEGVKFSVGVHPDFNHLDPASYAQSHPLAPKSPSMHWGWASGYRFVAIEGAAGTNLSTGFEIHALGDALYFEAEVLADGVDENGNMHINLDADYAGALKDIDVSAGVITHGDFAEAVDLLGNFKREVFKASQNQNPTGIFSVQDAVKDIKTYPNPSTGEVFIAHDKPSNIESIQVYNTLGSLVQTIQNTNQALGFYLPLDGFYYVKFLGDSGQPIGYSNVLIRK